MLTTQMLPLALILGVQYFKGWVDDDSVSHNKTTSWVLLIAAAGDARIITNNSELVLKY